jgi:DNA polymerase III subunit epsilon
VKWLLDGPLACFDCETTGLNLDEDRIVTATVALLQPGTPWAVQSRSWLIDPGVDISPEATAVHGITNEQAKEHGLPPEGALDEIADRLMLAFLSHIPVVGMNVPFDFTISDRELRRHHLPTLEERLGRPIGPVLDVLVLDKYLDPYRKGKRKLTDLCEHFNVRIDGAHDSAFDALAAARIAYQIARIATGPTDPQTLSSITAAGCTWPVVQRLYDRGVAARFAELGAMTAADLHDCQVGWRAEQQASLAKWFTKKGEDASGCDPSWPMIPRRPAVEPAGEVLTQ